eukprot:SAG11_NODE_8952_length_959_cov_1.365116_2_plen_70_part_00
MVGVGMSGRDLFDFKPDVFIDDADAGVDDDIEVHIRAHVRARIHERAPQTFNLTPTAICRAGAQKTWSI